MRFVLTRDPAELAQRAGALLAERIECNVLATVLSDVLVGAYPSKSPLFAYGVDGGGTVRVAAMRTPPWPMIVSPLGAADPQELLAVWLAEDPGLPGAGSVRDSVRALAAAWERLTGGATRCAMREAMHVLDEVRDPPRPASGALRLATSGERELLVAWMEAFASETGAFPADRAASVVDARLERQGMLVWDDSGPVCAVGVSPAVAGVVRIGLVYTPPEQRGRGYAGTAVAAATRRALDEGASRCMLYTDVTNPTSNKIYAEVGYRRCGDWEEHRFEAGRAS
jgi:GNAT superfamily N-acetyltransferase